MRRIEVSMVVIKQGEVFLLQRRGYDSNLGKSGLIGFFGGKKKEDESSEDAALRELDEEVRIDYNPIALTSLGKVIRKMGQSGNEIEVHAEAFGLDLPQSVVVSAKEYELVEMIESEIFEDLTKLTPATSAYFQEIF